MQCVDASEILLMFAHFGLIFHAYGLFAAWSLLSILQLVPLIWFMCEIYFVIKVHWCKFSHDSILIYFVPNHFFNDFFSFLIILWLQQNGTMTTRTDWWDCLNIGKRSYNWSCVWCFDVACTKFATTNKKTTWGIPPRS
jgi:hypothetical protein